MGNRNQNTLSIVYWSPDLTISKLFDTETQRLCVEIKTVGYQNNTKNPACRKN